MHYLLNKYKIGILRREGSMDNLAKQSLGEGCPEAVLEFGTSLRTFMKSTMRLSRDCRWSWSLSCGQSNYTVIDHTGLPGEYDFTLTWTPNKTQPAHLGGSDNNQQGSSILTAIQQQLVVEGSYAVLRLQ